jgi:hypothetical protein
VYSVNSLNNNEDAVEEHAITGTWKEKADSEYQLCFEKADRNTYNMIVTSSDSKPGDDSKSDKEPEGIEVYLLTLVRLDNQLFADLVSKEQALNGTKIGLPIGAVSHHMILKLDLTDTDLGYSPLDVRAIREANKQGYAPLSYVEIGGDDILLTASTEDLRWAVSRYADQLFGEGGHYTRVISADGSSQPCHAIQTSP